MVAMSFDIGGVEPKALSRGAIVPVGALIEAVLGKFVPERRVDVKLRLIVNQK